MGGVRGIYSRLRKRAATKRGRGICLAEPPLEVKGHQAAFGLPESSQAVEAKGGRLGALLHPWG